ncbi:MAG: gliding motility-associated C-terminal domain-containing protein [Bacteroidetes bacterium]|nr:gliding motility-associated C-terminal domain-containing protein [Bacteroidota bacterium]MDA0860941.1 gliding motility-associated C-terminal domain-containing protein [Bacteroidota bacterium]
MADSFGDGWNGATVNIIVNGVIALEGATITGGSSGSETFEAATGDTIELDWTNTGSWPSEISWTIDDGEGTEISSGNTSNTNGGTAFCPTETTSGPSCTHTFNMFDSFGDGWNGFAADILVNGVVVLESATITDGAAGTAEFQAATGDSIELSWTTGSWASEISWTITDGEGTQISSGNTSNTNGGTAFCPPPTPCTHTFNMADSFGDGWNGFAADILVNGVVVLESATITDGAAGTAEFQAATGDSIELSWTTGSWASEISWTITDGGGTQISSGNTSTTNGGTGNCPDCLPPTGLTLDSVSTTGAVVSWTGGDATSWEYELVIAGETPTGVGIATTTNPLTITGCYSNTAYDLYVRTDCGGVYSSWVAMSFTTSPACGDTIYDTGGANDNYSNNELITVTVFPENPGDVVTFTFLSFNTESCCDDLTVYDGPDTTSTVVGTYAGTAIPDPIISTHISGALTFVFVSDSGVTRDGYEILVTCAPPPTCSAPTGLAISNIGGTTADFDWNAFDGNQSWEYVVVPTGDPAPTTSGTFSAINSTTLTDLEFLTTYDVYVRAFCGEEDGYSVWSGPVTFTTTQQTDYTIDCSLGEPVNINYCYTNNDTTYWLFTSTDGFPLKIEFNAGTIEGFWDDLTIYDGPDNTFPVLFNNNDADIEDFTGLVVESTFPAVYVEVDSDGSASCESSWSGSYIPWDFDVSCKTCITQTVEFSIDGACEPIQEFYINANVADMGDAINLELTDNQGSPAQTTTQTGIVTFGPYPANQQVVITVVNSDDTSCSVDSDPLTFLCPPPPNDCSIVYAGEDTYFCSDGSTPVTLSASYHVFGQDTTSYDVTVQENCPAPNLSGGSPTSVNTDDIWSEVIDLGFEFCFFGETYSQVLIGSNGVLSFELENAETNNGWNLQSWFSTSPDTLPNSSNPTLSEGNIFGVGHDIDPSECGDINYMILGSAPARQFVVNYNEVCHFGFECSDNTSTSQIILYESSNVIDVNIIDKPLCTEWNDGLAVVGIQNIDDTVAFVAPDRNTSAWETSNEFWRFSPSVGEANYTFGWYDGDTFVSHEDTITVTPDVTTTYTAAVTYNLCNGDTATVTDTVVVELAPTPVPVPVSDEFQGCINEDLILEVNVDPTQESTSLVYYWSYNNEDVQIGPDNTYTIPAYSDLYGEYTVTAFNEETGCFSSTTIFSSTYLNQNCVDIPQGISPNGDGYNDCLILDHLEAQEDIIKAEIYNRYGVKVFELNDYVDHWCGQDASDGNLDSDELLPVGTYFYVIQYASEREPTISWIYLNY